MNGGWRSRWGRRARRVYGALAAIRRYFPLTNLGVLIAAVSAGCYFGFALPRADYVLELVSMLGLTLVGLAVVLVIPGALLLARAYRKVTRAGQEPVLLEANRGFAIMLRMPSFRGFPLIDVSWRWETPSGFHVSLERQRGEILERAAAYERGRATEIRRRFTIEDAFGLARIDLVRTEARTIEVLPFTGKLGAAPMLRSHAGGEELPHPFGSPDGDRVDMRHYVPGDPLKLALWKIYARTGELMIRVPERAISPSWRIVAYLPAAELDEPAAAAARVAITTGLFGEGWRFSADGADRIADDRASAEALVVSSRTARGTPAGDAAGLAAFCANVGDTQKTRLILFLPAVSGPWLGPVVESIRRWSGAVTCVVATDGVEEEGDDPRGSPWSRWMRRLLRRPEPKPLGLAKTTQRALREVTEPLARAGAFVVAVDRPSGRLLSEGRALERSAA
ncbi:MAG: DUF58 domain-containing protein [Myxococcota bacterium]